MTRVVIPSRKWIQGGTVITPEETIPNGTVVVEGEKIVYVGSREDAPSELLTGAELVEAGAYTIVPGYVDVHVHGGGGADALDGTPEAIMTVARAHARQGTTSFLVTAATASAEDFRRTARSVLEVMQAQAAGGAPAAADVVGMHLEGPFLAPSRKGAQNEKFIRAVDERELEELLALLGPSFRMMTVAPDAPGGLAGIRWLVRHGIVASIGHTDASFELTKAAVALGANHATHTFNAMRGLHHRDPGTVGAVLTSPGVFCELIADGIHVHPGAMRLVYEAKGADRLVLVTDALSAMGRPDGTYELAGKTVVVKGGVARLETGELAGSTLSMGQAVANLVRRVGVSLAEAVRAASLTPARSIGLDDRKGSLAPGKDADLLLLNPELAVARVMIRGTWLETGNEVKEDGKEDKNENNGG